jgi:excisionase family DNA binding protein
MTNEILLNGISFEQLQNSIKTIVSAELKNAVIELTESQKDTAPELITRKETADILGVSLPTLHEWTKKGVLPAKRIGTRVRYEKRAVMDALKDIETIKYRRA